MSHGIRKNESGAISYAYVMNHYVRFIDDRTKLEQSVDCIE